MAISDYDVIKTRLLRRNKELLEEIYNDKYREHKRRILEGIDNDERHNAIVNFLY